MLFIIKQQPIKLLFIIPLDKLAELLPHEQQLFTGVGHHISVKGPQRIEFIVIFARHFIYERAFSVHNLVMGNWQNIIFRKGVKEGKRQGVVAVFSINAVQRHISDHVVHPAHVPFEIKSQSARKCGLCHKRPRRRFLGNHHNIGETGENRLVELFYKGDRLKIFVSAVNIRRPLARLPSVVEIKHGGHRVHPKAVDVIIFKPINGIGNQKALNLVFAVIEDLGSPFLMLALAAVGIFIAGAAVKIGKTAFVLGKMSRHPVENDSYSL